jgi:uncharacterized protein
MHIIFISDLHNHFDAIAKLPQADLLIVGGDFTQLGTADEVLAAVKRIEAHFPDFVCVGGNMDCPNADDVLRPTGHLLELDKTTVRGCARMRGCGGGNTSPFNTPFEWSDEEMAPRLAAIPAGEINILVTHAPALNGGADRLPNGIGCGSKALADFLQVAKPVLHLCGHIHEARGIYEFGETRIVNPGPFGDDGVYADIVYDGAKLTRCELTQCVK